MKKLFFTTLTVIVASLSVAYAQEITIEGLSSEPGVMATHTGDRYFTFYMGEHPENKDMANFVFNIYDHDLQFMKAAGVEMTKPSQLAASASSGDFFLFMFVDPVKKSRTLLMMDREGNVMHKKQDDDIRSALLMPENFPEIYSAGLNEFVIVRTEKNKPGFEVERITPELSSEYVKSFSSEETNMTIQDIKVDMDRLYLLKKKKNATGEQGYSYSVQAIVLPTGEVAYDAELTQGAEKPAPAFIRVEHGQVITAGDFYGVGNESKESQGVFFASIGYDGKLQKFAVTPWNVVKEHVRNDFSSELTTGRLKVLMQDIVATRENENYILVGETYRSSSVDAAAEGSRKKGKANTESGSAAGITVMDFAFFHFDRDGMLTGIEKVEKPHKEAVIKGHMAAKGEQALAQWLDEKSFFSYRDAVTINMNRHILYENDEAARPQLVAIPVQAAQTENRDSLAAPHQIEMAKAEGRDKKGNKAKVATTKKYTLDSGTGNTPDAVSRKGYISSGEGRALIYEYERPRLLLQVQPLMLNNPHN